MDKEQQAGTSKSLEEILSESSLTIKQLAKMKGILTQVRNSFDIFVKFCLHDQSRCIDLIQYGIKTVSFDSIQDKKICSFCNQILCDDNEGIVQLFIRLQIQEERSNSKSQDDECEVITDVYFQEDENKFNKKYANLLYLLNYAISPQSNEISLNYLNKLLSIIVNVNPQDLYLFFAKKEELLHQLIQKATKNLGISQFLAKFIGEETDTKQFRTLKGQIIFQMLKKMSQNIQNKQNFQNIIFFMDIVMTKNKYRGEEITELSIVSHRIVEADVIEFFYEQIFKNNQIIFINSISYLLLVTNRMNTDEQIDPYYSRINPNYVQQPTMNFQTNQLYSQFSTLLTFKLPQNYSKLTLCNYYDFLLKLTQNSRWKHTKIQQINCLIFLLKMFKELKSGGILNGYLCDLIGAVCGKIQEIDGKNVMRIISALNLYRKGIFQGKQVFLHKIMAILMKKSKKIEKHCQVINLNENLKKYKTSLAGSSHYFQNKQQNIKQLSFLSEFQFQEEYTESVQLAQKKTKISMQFCQQVFENTIIFPNEPFTKSIELGIQEIQSQEEFEEEEEEEIDQLVLWREGNPIQKYYLPHLYIF